MSSIPTSVGDDDLAPVRGPQPLAEFGAPLPPADTMPEGSRPPVPAPLSDAIRLLLGRYEMSTDHQLPSTIAVTSAVHGEGVTTLSRSLASVLASDLDANVCRIDLGWGAPRSKRSAEQVLPGICEVLRGSSSLDEVIRTDPLQPRVTNVPLGDQQRGDSARLARSPELREVIEDLLRRNDHLVLDAGAVLESTEALYSLRHADAYLLVVRQGSTSGRQVEAVADELRTIPSLGAVLNQYRTRTPAMIRNRLNW